MSNDDLLSLRIVHLHGGLRAFDFGDPQVTLGPAQDVPLLGLGRPAYRELFAALANASFPPIGVDFLTHKAEVCGIAPPDWRVFNLQSGFSALDAEQAWGNVRHVAGQKTPEIADFAGRFTTYHRLLNLRIRELSDAYARALRARLLDDEGRYEPPSKGGLFSNGFLTYIEAAIHAFLADAAGFRDLIAEAAWRLVLREGSADVTTLGSFLKRTRTRHHPITEAMRVAGANGGWLKNLTDLRNAVTHIAPMANTHEIRMIDLRLRTVGTVAVAQIHYPLTTSSGGSRDRPARIDFTNEAQIRGRLEEYRDFVAKSGDALAYAAITFQRLVSLAKDVRLASGLKSEILHLTDKDIIGPVTIRRG